MGKQLRETGIAAVIFGAFNWFLGIGAEDGEQTIQGFIVSVLVFAIFYFLIGLAIKAFKARKR